MVSSTDTIYALSSGTLPAGVAVLRLSGSQAMVAMSMLTGGRLPAPRVAALRTIRNRNKETIDQALVIQFPAPHSFTGEDCVEIHLHGSKAVVDAVFTELDAIDHIRPAEAGEFSKRAYDNGKMDLLEVEGLADLLKAETEMQRRLAVEQTCGQLSALYDDWAYQLTRCRALIEAELDFSDEEDVPDSVADQVWVTVSRLKTEISDHLNAGGSSEIIRNGFKVALIGSPNVGKSSLLNAMSGRDIAIVTDIAGTTRDVISTDLDIGGYLVTIYDTAGLRDTDDVVEREGVRRARASAAEADLVLSLFETDSDAQQIDLASNVSIVTVATKTDLYPERCTAPYDLVISAKTGEGLVELKSLIRSHIETRVGVTHSLVPVRARHKKRLEETLNYVSDALNSEGMDLAVRSEYLRLAATSLGRITGRVDVEELLGVIFSEFCIGK
ncbi:tRNA uridine-5-carboxymethylaminomethyl(34) synthesis GTPase MnmE [Agrobacterium vaccinii]|uniref:tRNA uridine-5-carboxymethylaminomethyl(34) synthesis GTPase MnmE n=1 Tax=Agrobacterium vaccinii TaxID=2735528 RepID=UPI001E29B329|nr:tRNA uridine-5-carboxymethylaminomethyl(34) synthesis GTPase MnmE [Agrobacterium vaccinii]UHS62640.1 tRNA uridine-5-carboxymethylaminomethyl(34) synthesis GTPase MnmE [Agrobacterium vaccinii]